jgi:putative transport protein
MMSYLADLIASSPLLLLFFVTGLGYLLGNIKVAGFSLGPAAVLFTGMLFGALDPRFRIPDLIYVLGLILFVYTIGLQSGPTFFASFGRRAIRANAFGLAAIVVAAGLCYAAWKLFSLDGASIVGVFSGSLTNTPSLAASVEAIKAVLQGTDTSPADVITKSNAPVVGYGISYPFGVIGVLLGFQVFDKYWKKNRLQDDWTSAADPGESPEGPIGARTYRVVNPGIIGKSVSDVFSLDRDKGFVLSRMRRGKDTSLVYKDTVFQPGDLVVAVGNDRAHQRAHELFGEESPIDIRAGSQEFDYRRIDVSDKKVIGKTIGELNLQSMLDATITRIRRGDTDFVPSGSTVLERGDRIRVLTWTGNVERVARFFGDSIRGSSETDFLSLSLGIVLGVLLGMVPLHLPGGTVFTLGFAGGPLIVGLVLGRFQRSGSITWTMPFSANLTLRQVGLVLFLAGIGTKAGDGLLRTLEQGGWEMLAVGAVVTSVVTVMTLLLGVRLLKFSLPAVMGLMSGIQTQPACLAFANERYSSNAPNVWYASVYPLSMIAKIVLAQLLVGRML